MKFKLTFICPINKLGDVEITLNKGLFKKEPIIIGLKDLYDLKKKYNNKKITFDLLKNDSEVVVCKDEIDNYYKALYPTDYKHTVNLSESQIEQFNLQDLFLNDNHLFIEVPYYYLSKYVENKFIIYFKDSCFVYFMKKFKLEHILNQYFKPKEISLKKIFNLNEFLNDWKINNYPLIIK